ncbi:nuclear envelope protein [Histoplasma capsulatum var. duboisii H88]|uniref:Nuclear envelope protein n=1 Tax=Ajellomyces capsulatus (strain H88) TaxID=544711 RepID=F0U5B9_AJEC8|nr:nuclear envelope protein [Histoplasma capsulatum var. duboisii H88]QSS51464.1 nuclear envelope protein [Histoplasma capsulatum var. duboisii H88]
MAAASSSAVAARPRQYRRLLTSTLHRKFVHASAVSLVACYVVAFLIGVKSSFFWSWFPLGACGFRTILLFFSCLAIFILRVGQMRMGTRTTSSPFSSARQALFSLSTFQTFGWYLLSAWWFTEVSMWSSSESADLNWVKLGKPFERAKLNERPIYLHCFYALLAVSQATLHLYFDWDKIRVPISNRTSTSTHQSLHALEPLPVRIRKAMPQILYDAVIRSSIAAIVGPFIYMLFLRRIAWNWVLSFAKLFWNFPRSAADPPGLIPPLHILLMLRVATTGVLLVMLWQVSNLLFSTFLGQAPLKRGQPLTNESKDPNGSLINGLNAKKDVVRTFAFWELCLISQQYPERRKAIFADIDRNGGPAWSQIFSASTNVIKGITARINEHRHPTPLVGPNSTLPRSDSNRNIDGQPAIIHTLPRLTSPPREDNIFLASSKPATGSEKLESAFSSVAKSYGQSPDWTPAARDQARNIFNRATTAVLSPERKKRISSSAQELKLLTGPHSSSSSDRRSTHPIIHKFLSSLVGLPFRQSYARRLRTIILGTPYASLSPIIDAVESLTRLLIASLAEDQFGKVQADIAAAVHLFTETIISLESFTSVDDGGLDIHWTDVDFPPTDAGVEIQKKARRVEEVEMIKEALRRGLSELLETFKLYLDDVGVRGNDLKMAREAVGLV